MISEKHRCIFIHVPKTGGNSIKTILGLHRHLHSPASHKPEELLSEYFSFSFVRNPWDRLVSSYVYLKNGGMGSKLDMDAKEKYIDNFKTFKDFVLNIDQTGLPNQQHLRQQTFWIDRELDFIGKFENLQQDFNKVCDKLDILKQELPHTNKTNHKHYTEYYDDETRQIVAEKYAKDIEYFGYEFRE
tara:strand:+ start:306 stop:866 length:561 start_codon:yes stop_codon:yes gene_type:complete